VRQDLEAFGRALTWLRKRANLGQEELAARVGVSRQSIGSYETGKFHPSVDVLFQLLEALEATVADLGQAMAAIAKGLDPADSYVAEAPEAYRVDAKRQRYPWAPDELLQRWARAEQLADFALREQYEIDRLIDQHRRRALEQQRNPG
jgi:transcriptional regulator with XRE-family HTH domain